MVKYRTANYKDNEQIKGQTFDRFKPVYRLNPATNVLEKTDEVIDVQELVDSCKETCLQTCLDRFFPTGQTIDTAVSSYNSMLDDLDYFREMSNLAEDYKVKFNLPADYSTQQVFEEVKKQSVELKTKIENYKKLEVKKDEEKASIEESK